MTVRDLYEKAKEFGYLDAEVLMNVNLEPIPVKNALLIADMQIGDMTVFKHVVILDN